MHIIIRREGKGTSGRQYQGFHPHYNRALGKQINTVKEYDRELKSRGLEMYDPKRPVAPKMKEHKVSRETRKVVEAIKHQTQKGEFKPTGELQKELIKRGVLKKRDELEKIKEKMPKESGQAGASGGFY